MQVKLLRVIQEKTVRPVGEPREETVDVRILSATHQNLADLVAQGQFREDLYYRINVIELRVPALRERSDDMPRAGRGHPAAPGAAHEHRRTGVSAEDAMAVAADLRLSRQRARTGEHPGARTDPVHPDRA